MESERVFGSVIKTSSTTKKRNVSVADRCTLKMGKFSRWNSDTGFRVRSTTFDLCGYKWTVELSGSHYVSLMLKRASYGAKPSVSVDVTLCSKSSGNSLIKSGDTNSISGNLGKWLYHDNVVLMHGANF
jgi:hypothetical protein